MSFNPDEIATTALRGATATMPTPAAYGLYRTDPNLIEMVADSPGLAKTFKAMFGGPRWKIRKLTPAEMEHPFVVAELAALAERREESESL